MSIDNTIVRRIAGLANIEISEQAETQLQQDLNKILDYVGQLAQVDTDNVEPLISPMLEQAVWRTDGVAENNIADKVLQNAPESEMGFFVVPKVVDNA